MVQRMIFGFDGNGIVEFPVEINWDLGFDKAAKLEYINRVCDAAYCRYGLDEVLDVTTANSSIENGRILSPHILKCYGGNMSVDAYFSEHGKNTLSPVMQKVAFAYYYMFSVCHNAEAYILFDRYNYFFDVFWKIGGGDTQAYTCVLLKKAIYENKHKEFFKEFSGIGLIGFKNWFIKNYNMCGVKLKS